MDFYEFFLCGKGLTKAKSNFIKGPIFCGYLVNDFGFLVDIKVSSGSS